VRSWNLSVQAAEIKQTELFSSLQGLNRLALAVSGGSDSMAMLLKVRAWAAPHVQIFALTVDHGLRLGAAAEARQVSEWCAAIGVSHQVLKWEHGAILNGVQAKARRARYDLMSAWCADHNVPVLLTGHTADDQAETVAMRRERTDSLNSIAGIWPEREWNGIRVLRPLLDMRRQELRDYLKTLNQDWFEDPSNFDLRFERVRMRHKLAGDVYDFEEQAKAAQRHVRTTQGEAMLWRESHFDIHETGYLTVSRKELAKLSCDVMDWVLVRMIDLCGSKTRRNDRAERLEMQHWLVQDGGGRRTLGGALFAKRKNGIIVGREAGRISADAGLVSKTGEIVWDDRFLIKAPSGASVVPLQVLAKIPRRTELPAFVQAGLPAVLKDGEVLAIPHLKIGPELDVKFLRH
jgi:tRNA(Ile)-lysidine synthase